MNHIKANVLPQELQAEYPFEGNSFEQTGTSKSGNFIRMHYLDEGEGPVVLMLHGNPTWSFYYRNLVKTLVAAGFRCIVPDHVGCGLSDKPQDYPYTLKRRIEDVERLIDHLGIDRFSLIVHDWGGAIGCGLAGRRSEALEKLVVLNTAAFRSKRIPWRIAAIKPPIIGEFAIRGLNGFAGPAVSMAVESRLPGHVRKGYLWPYRSWADRVAIWNFVKDIPLNERHTSYATLLEVENNLHGLKGKPVQIVWGAKDFCFNLHFFDRWREFFPEAETHLHKESGHYVLEDGGTLVQTQILSFIQM